MRGPLILLAIAACHRSTPAPSPPPHPAPPPGPRRASVPVLDGEFVASRLLVDAFDDRIEIDRPKVLIIRM